MCRYTSPIFFLSSRSPFFKIETCNICYNFYDENKRERKCVSAPNIASRKWAACTAHRLRLEKNNSHWSIPIHDNCLCARAQRSLYMTSSRGKSRALQGERTLMSRMAWLRLERWFSLVEAVVRFRLAGMKCRSKSAKEASGVWVRPGIRMLRSLSSLMGRSWVPGDSRSRT